MPFASQREAVWTLLISVLVFGCRERDTIPPEVHIDLPAEGTVFTVFDTVRVQFQATDDVALLSASVQIVNTSMLPVTASVPAVVDSEMGFGQAEVIIHDKLVPTGDHYVLVTARDEANETREFKAIRIIGLPKERRAIYFSTPTSGGTIWKVDSLFQDLNEWGRPGHDILKLCVNSLNDRLTVVGNYSTGIINYDLAAGNTVWTDAVFGASAAPRFTDLLCHENDVFVALFDYELRSYNLSGSLTMNHPTGAYRPETIFMKEPYFLVEMGLVGGDAHFIHVYHAQTRAFLRELQIPMNVKAICTLEGDEVLLFGNDGNQARVLRYNIAVNGYWEPRQLPSGKIFDAVRMDGSEFAIAHENGLYAYTYSPNYLNLILGGTRYQDVSYDVDNGTVLAAAGRTLEEVAPNGQLLHSIVHSDSISSIDIHYTK